MEQMTIWNYLKVDKPKEYPPIIEELDKDLMRLFDGCKVRKKSYRVWKHVPNLGKRYCLWVAIKKTDDIMSISFEPIIKKYKDKKLEVSINSTGSFLDGYDYSLMISTLWTTKGHKEVID